MRENLLKEHAGKFVAVYKGKVIDSDADKRALGKRVFAKYGRAPVYFQQATTEPAPAVRIRTSWFINNARRSIAGLSPTKPGEPG